MMQVPPRVRREPIFNMPAPIVATIGLLLAIHVLREIVPDAVDFGLVLDFGFIPARWSLAVGVADVGRVVADAGVGTDGAAIIRESFARYVAADAPFTPWSVVTYALLHGSWLHVALNATWLAAFGTPVVRRCGLGRALALTLATAVAGAAAHWLAHPTGVQPMIGASAVVSGFMAAAATFAFSEHAPAAAIGSAFARTFRNRTALTFLGSWFVVNLLFGLFAAPLGITDASIAWEAHLGGLAAGLALFPVLDPAEGR